METTPENNLLKEMQTLTPRQAGQIFGASEDWVKWKIRIGELSAFLVGNRYRITYKALEEFQQRLKEKLKNKLDNRTGIYSRNRMPDNCIIAIRNK